MRELKKAVELFARCSAQLLDPVRVPEARDAAAARRTHVRAWRSTAVVCGAQRTAARALVESGELQKGIRNWNIQQQAPDSPQTRYTPCSAYAKAGRAEDAARENVAEFLSEQLTKKPEEQ